MTCRHCGKELEHRFVDLGFSPPSNSYLRETDLNRVEKYYPLRVMVCDGCWLVQTQDYAGIEELFSAEYAYFSSTSSSWLEHANKFSTEISEKLKLNSKSLVVEIASNDGYLLKNFVAQGIPCFGIEPTASTAEVSKKMGIKVIQEFFGEDLAKKLAESGCRADLIVGNNVFAHVPNINDFTRGLKLLLNSRGVITLEFPHLMKLIDGKQFDTIYHEHFSYLSLHAVDQIFISQGLKIWDVERLNTHGGSLRVYGCHSDDPRPTADVVSAILCEEQKRGLQSTEIYLDFQDCIDEIKDNLTAFLIQQKRDDKSVWAYGAAAKGNTLLNYAGIKPDLVQLVCDAAIAKQQKYMPGSHIPIIPPDILYKAHPDYLLILPWNIADEIKEKFIHLENLGTKFIVAIPELKVL